MSNAIAVQNIEKTDQPTLQGFVEEHAAPGAAVHTNEHSGYVGMPFDHETTKHSVSE